jgi:hypothetical protein
MLIQEKISGADTLLKLYGAIDEDLKALRPHLQATHLPRDPRGGTPHFSAAEILTIVVWGAWRGLGDKAKGYVHLRTYPHPEFPELGAYSKFVEATNRYSVELRAVLALRLHRHRHAQGAHPIVRQDSSALESCPVARARQHRTFRDWARQSKNGMGGWDGFKLPGPCEEAGRLCGFDLTTATVEDRKLLDPLTQWRKDGSVVGDGGSLSQAKAKALAHRGVSLFTSIRKNMRHGASQVQLACLILRHRGEEVCEFRKALLGLSARRTGLRMRFRFTCCVVYWPLLSSSP